MNRNGPPGLPALKLERITGFEPISTVWKTVALPLCYTRVVKPQPDYDTAREWMSTHFCPLFIGSGCDVQILPSPGSIDGARGFRNSKAGELGRNLRHEPRPVPVVFDRDVPRKSENTLNGKVVRSTRERMVELSNRVGNVHVTLLSYVESDDMNLYGSEMFFKMSDEVL